MYELVRHGDYPGTDLPNYGVYPANDPKAPFIGEVWAIGVKGVTGQWIPTGVRYQLNGDYTESPVFAAGNYAGAAREMISKYEGK